MARGKDWKTAKASKIEQFRTVDRVQVDNPIAPPAAGQGGVDRLPSELPTSGADTSSVGTWGFDDTTRTPSDNVTTATQDMKPWEDNGGLQLQNDVTKAQITEGYMPGIEKIETPPERTTTKVDYNIPGGEVRTAEVETWQEDGRWYGQYGDSVISGSSQQNVLTNAPRFVQMTRQQELQDETGSSAAWNALDPNSKADPGSLFPVTRTDQETGKTYDVFFGGKGKMPTDKQQVAIEDAFVQQDFNKMWTNVKSNIGASLGINSRGYDYYADPSGDGSGIIEERTLDPYVNFGKKSPQTDMSKIFGFYKDKHKGNKEIVDEITAMENRWTIGGTKAEGTSGLFGFKNTGSKSNNPLSYYEDLAKNRMNPSYNEMGKKGTFSF